MNLSTAFGGEVNLHGFYGAIDDLSCAHDHAHAGKGGYIGGGMYHSQNIEGSLVAIPGVRIFYPTFADDAAVELLSEFRGRPDLVIGNYSDGNLVATLLSDRFDVIQCTIAHALEKTKYLFSDLYWQKDDNEYHFSVQFSAVAAGDYDWQSHPPGNRGAGAAGAAPCRPRRSGPDPGSRWQSGCARSESSAARGAGNAEAALRV